MLMCLNVLTAHYILLKGENDNEKMTKTANLINYERLVEDLAKFKF